ncbi:MAG TPA: hypothetical protein VF581_01620 [Flavobacterium sp.]
MKYIIIIIMALAILLALYEQSKAEPNLYIMIICIVIFMFGMMRLSSKIPSKNKENGDDNA